MKFALFYILLIVIALIVMSTPIPQPSSTIIDPVLSLVVTILLGISGWVAFFYRYYSERPRIRGKILQVMTGNMANPTQLTERLTSFILFLYLTNARKNAIHLSNYILEVDAGNGFETVKMVRGFADSLNIHFSDRNGAEIQIPDFNKGLIYKQSKPVEYGVPFYGYLVFAGDIKYYDQKIKCFKITLVDIFDHKHKITANPEKDFVDLFYLQETFKIKIPNVVPSSHTPENTPQTASSLINGNDVIT